LSVIDHPKADRLNVNTLGEFTLISNKKEDGSARYKVGQLMIHIPIGAIVPNYLLKDGYWDEKEGKGILGGEDGNIVEGRKMKGIVSQGLIMPLDVYNDGYDFIINGNGDPYRVFEGDDVTDFLGIEFN